MPFSARKLIRQHLAVVGRAAGRVMRRIARNLMDVDSLHPGPETSEPLSQRRQGQGQPQYPQLARAPYGRSPQTKSGPSGNQLFFSV